MRRFFDSEILSRLLFTAIVVGILLAAYGALRFVDLANQLAGNAAAQIQASGEEVTVESKAQAQGLMASDIEMRRLGAEQRNMMIVGGLGLALLGMGWLGTDLLGARRRRAHASHLKTEPTVDEAEAPAGLA